MWQYTKKLRFLPEKRRWDEGYAALVGSSKRSGSWRMGSSGEEGRVSEGFHTRRYGPTKSDSLSWRKEEDKTGAYG